jgi:hypothetical protein
VKPDWIGIPPLKHLRPVIRHPHPLLSTPLPHPHPHAPGFKSVLATGNELAFQTLVQETTQRFNACSHRVIAMEQRLKEDLQKGEVAALFRQVQEQEREKLRLTATLQVLRKSEAEGRWSWQQEGGGEEEEEEAGPSHAHAHAQASSSPYASNGTATNGTSDTAESGHSHSHDHGHHGSGGGCGCGAPPPEPTREEFRSAVREAVQLLQGAAERVRDLEDELRYMLAELQGEEA